MARLPLSPDDGSRLRAAAAGEPEAVRWLLDDVAPIVHGFLWARVGGNRQVTEDLLQETLLSAIAAASTFRGESAVSTWMCGIARHGIARHWEKERKQELAQSRLRAVTDEVTDDHADELLRREEVTQALGRLPALHRQVLVLKYLDELGVQEIAEQVGRTRVQVQSLLQRARDGLRRELGESA